MKERFDKLGVEPLTMTPEAFDARIAQEIEDRGRTRQGDRSCEIAIVFVHRVDKDGGRT